MSKRLFIIIALLSAMVTIGAQSSFNKAELTVGMLFQHLKKDTVDANKRLINDSIYTALNDLLSRETSLDYDFKIDGLRKIKASNGKVAVYTWCYLTASHTLVFNGFIQRKVRHGIRLYPLHVNEAPYTPDEAATISPDNWYGAAYFDIYPFLSKEGTAYILLGWAQNKPFVTMKTIDVLWFDDNEDAHLGLPIWQVLKKEYLARAVFQYNNDVSTTLLYEPQNKRFVFDHLVPLNSGMVGNYIYYAPDSSYDAYKKKPLSHCWLFQQDVEVE